MRNVLGFALSTVFWAVVIFFVIPALVIAIAVYKRRQAR